MKHGDGRSVGSWGPLFAVYLASQASSYATGEQYLIDGGYTKF